MRNTPPLSTDIALLSAVSLVDARNEGGAALQPVFGQPLLSLQIETLLKFGINFFAVEVESIGGELIALADRFRQKGVRLEFVRSVQELQALIDTGGKLIIQSEAHYMSPSVMAEFVQETAPFVATLDDRSENSDFERIDINTRWAGLAILDGSTVRSLGPLPDGWSICSSLLRHAIQNRARFRPFPQAHVQNGNLLRIGTTGDAEIVSAVMMRQRINLQQGLVEKNVFARLSARLAPLIWTSSQAIVGVGVSRFALAGASIIAASLGWGVATAITATLALFARTTHQIVCRANRDEVRAPIFELLFWAMLASAAFVVTRSYWGYGSGSLVIFPLIAGMMLVSQKLALPQWIALLLRSPALFALSMLIAISTARIDEGLAIFALVQMGLSLFGLYRPDTISKFGNQA